MTMTTGLRIAFAFAIAAAIGCADAGGTNKNRAGGNGKATNNVPVAANKDPAAKSQQQPLMNTREDWKNVPKSEPPPPREAVVSKDYDNCTVKAVDADRRLITLTVAGQEVTLRVSPNAFIEEPSFRSYALQGGLSAIHAGNTVFIVTAQEGGQDVVQRIKLRANTN
jgi:hypothetical protein